MRDIHPDYREVVFWDTAAGKGFLTRSTLSPSGTMTWEDGKDYPVVRVDVSSLTHPFYTGQQRVLDTAGRVEQFRRRYGTASRPSSRRSPLNACHGPSDSSTGQVDRPVPVTGLRSTRQRAALGQVLVDIDDFRSAQQLHHLLQQRGEAVGLTTVYRALQSLQDAGEVDVVLRADGEALYRRCGAEHHHHLVCRRCGRTVEVAGPAVERWARAVAEEHGYRPGQSHRRGLRGMPELRRRPRGAHRRRAGGRAATMKKAVVAVLGGLLTLLGVAALVLPGPGFVLVASGLAVLSTQFSWARRPLVYARGKAEQGMDQVANSRLQAVGAGLGAAALLAVGILPLAGVDIPFLTTISGVVILLSGLFLVATLLYARSARWRVRQARARAGGTRVR